MQNSAPGQHDVSLREIVTLAVTSPEIVRFPVSRHNTPKRKSVSAPPTSPEQARQPLAFEALEIFRPIDVPQPRGLAPGQRQTGEPAAGFRHHAGGAPWHVGEQPRLAAGPAAQPLAR